MSKKEFFLVIIFFSLVIFFAYWRLPGTFFQQDEWQSFGATNYFLSLEKKLFFKSILPVASGISHFTPLASLFFRLEYILFKVNFPPYALVSLVFHLINSLLLFYFVYSLFKKKSLALFTGLFFAVNSFSHQAVSWVAAGAGLLQATTFLLLALVFFQKSLSLSLLMLFVASLFKETPLFLLLLLPFFWLIFAKRAKKRNLSEFKKDVVPFLIFGGLYFLLRLFFILGKFSSSQPAAVDISSPSPFTLFYRPIVVPLKALTQVFFSAGWLVSSAERIISLAYPFFIAADGAANPFVSQTIMVDLLSYFLAFLIFFVVFLSYKSLLKKKKPELARGLIFGLVFIITGSLPFVFIPGRGGFFSIFEPRNLYILNIGSALLLAIVLFLVASVVIQKKRSVSFLFFLFCLPFLVFHWGNIQKDLKKIQELGQLRKSFLVQIQEKYPKLPDKVIFYTQSDTAYYGLPISEKILPVQSGFGRMLMIWYQERERFPGCLYEEQFLYPLLSQDYQECQGRGFGYFRDYLELEKAVKENKISPENVIAFSWDSKAKKFEDITKQIINKL